MGIASFVNKVICFVSNSIFLFVFQYSVFLKYKLLSTCIQILGESKLCQLVKIATRDRAVFERNIVVEVFGSRYLSSGDAYTDKCKLESRISFDEGVCVNDNFVAITYREGIEIHLSCRISVRDFHNFHSKKRMGGVIETPKVTIGDNDFFGAAVRHLKGVSIIENSVIANGLMVATSILKNVIAGGIQAKVIRFL